MKKFVLSALATLLIISISKAQTTDTIPSKPDERISVNKEYDDNGNLIRFDSTYVYEWSGSDTSFNLGGGSMFPFDEKSMPDMKEMLQGLFNDSTFNHSPFSNHSFNFPFDFDDHFMDGWMDHFGDEMMNSDSLRESIFKQFHQGQFPRDMFDELNSNHPTFKNKEQEKEWMEMKKKHEKEMQDLLNKWE